jgi:phosphoribosylformimino-5-aminoimidazole carboxamide ribotide isomerase
LKIIPAIDLIGGKCVRLAEGDYSTQQVYADNPLDMALWFEKEGVKRLHLVDLDGAKARKVINWEVIESIDTHTNLEIDFGGGVQSDTDIERLFDTGVKQVTGGSIAVKNKPLFKSWIARYGAEKIILGADARNGKIAISGWEEDSGLDIISFIAEYYALGIREVICTDVAKDGMLMGPSFDLYQSLIKEFPELRLIASGGVTTISDVEKLAKMGIYGAIIGKALYEKTINFEELKPFL